MDESAHSQALFASLRVLASSTPGASLELGDAGVGAMTMTTPFALFNGVITTSLTPEVEEIDRWARLFETSLLPWSIQLRGEPTPALVALAASYGLTDTHAEPLMYASLSPAGSPDGTVQPAAGDRKSVV